MNALIPSANVHELIYLIRGQKDMLDTDLAELYDVETFNLNKAVKRNKKRFPPDFMFQLSTQEWKNLKFQFGRSSLRSQIGMTSWGGRRSAPYAFTEQGVAMLSSVLHSERAIEVNITIMRAFVRLRQLVSLNRALAKRLATIERKLMGHDVDIQKVYEIIQEMQQSPNMAGIGFIPDEPPEK
jgi:hypothetical protein